jgi:hypothetical protein
VRWHRRGINSSADVEVTTIDADRRCPDADGRPDPLDFEMRETTPARQESLDGTDETGNPDNAYVLLEKPESLDSLAVRRGALRRSSDPIKSRRARRRDSSGQSRSAESQSGSAGHAAGRPAREASRHGVRISIPRHEC